MPDRKRIELLAPAGDLERVKIAIRYGADAVYCGGKEMSLRNRAGNLTTEEIREACRFAKEHHAKIFVTVNMIPRDEDFKDIDTYLSDLERAGVSAIIVSSPEIVKRSKIAAPSMEVHLSTQQSVMNSAAVNFWKEFGADRVVLARECTMEEIRKIRSRTDLDLEVFIHGGMCSSFSGRCVLSNYTSARDANRGGCAQSCRWRYREENGEREISFGSKDLDASRYIGEMIDAGITSVKIEGRMKTAFYLASVIRSYRYLIDRYEENGILSEKDRCIASRIMGNVQNRETGPGFLEGIPGIEGLITPGTRDIVAQDYLGDILEYDAKEMKALVCMRNHLETGESAEILGIGGVSDIFTVDSLTSEEGIRKEVSNRPMEKLWIPVKAPCEAGDYLRRVRK